MHLDGMLAEGLYRLDEPSGTAQEGSGGSADDGAGPPPLARRAATTGAKVIDLNEMIRQSKAAAS